jgi:hypothetical protein
MGSRDQCGLSARACSEVSCTAPFPCSVGRRDFAPSAGGDQPCRILRRAHGGAKTTRRGDALGISPPWDSLPRLGPYGFSRPTDRSTIRRRGHNGQPVCERQVMFELDFLMHRSDLRR